MPFNYVSPGRRTDVPSSVQVQAQTYFLVGVKKFGTKSKPRFILWHFKPKGTWIWGYVPILSLGMSSGKTRIDWMGGGDKDLRLCCWTGPLQFRLHPMIPRHLLLQDTKLHANLIVVLYQWQLQLRLTIFRQSLFPWRSCNIYLCFVLFSLVAERDRRWTTNILLYVQIHNIRFSRASKNHLLSPTIPEIIVLGYRLG